MFLVLFPVGSNSFLVTHYLAIPETTPTICQQDNKLVCSPLLMTFLDKNKDKYQDVSSVPSNYYLDHCSSSLLIQLTHHPCFEAFPSPPLLFGHAALPSPSPSKYWKKFTGGCIIEIIAISICTFQRSPNLLVSGSMSLVLQLLQTSSGSSQDSLPNFFFSNHV